MIKLLTQQEGHKPEPVKTKLSLPPHRVADFNKITFSQTIDKSRKIQILVCFYSLVWVSFRLEIHSNIKVIFKLKLKHIVKNIATADFWRLSDSISKNNISINRFCKYTNQKIVLLVQICSFIILIIEVAGVIFMLGKFAIPVWFSSIESGEAEERALKS